MGHIVTTASITPYPNTPESVGAALTLRALLARVVVTTSPTTSSPLRFVMWRGTSDNGRAANAADVVIDVQDIVGTSAGVVLDLNVWATHGGIPYAAEGGSLKAAVYSEDGTFNLPVHIDLTAVRW